MHLVAAEDRLKAGTHAGDTLTRLKLPLRRFAYYAILLFCAVSALRLAIEVGVGLSSLKEAGHGDNYIFHTVQEYLRTGQIYPDLHNHDELPSLYSPFLYMVFSLPMRVGAWESSYVGPRLIVFVSFLVCIGLVASISRKLTDCRWPVSLLLACSFGVFQAWVPQLRADFMSIAFALLAIRLLLEDSPWCYAIAGLAGGFATQFKLTYVSAGVAGFIWLVYQRKWKPLVIFSGVTAMTSLGVYALMTIREPHMFQNLTVLRSTVRDVSAVGRFLSHLSREPILLLGVIMAPVLICSRRRPQWTLLALYFALSFAASTLLSMQAGGNINYFFESLFAITPFAAAGVLWLREQLTARGSVFVALLIFGFAIIPSVVSMAAVARSAKDVRVENRYFESLRAEFAGKDVFSTSGWAAHFTQRVPIPEPFLLSYLERSSKWDSAPWATKVLQQHYDLVVTDMPQITFRTVPHIPPKIHVAIEEAYQPFYACPGILLFHRRGENPDPATTSRFAAMGCHPVVCPSGAECRAW